MDGQRTEPILIFFGYLSALKKRWFPVMIFVALTVVVVGVISVLTTPIYEISATIEPGIIGKDIYDKILYNDTAENLANKIRRRAYDEKVLSNLGIDPKEESIYFQTRFLPNQKSVNISLDISDIERGKQILSELINLISTEKAGYINSTTAKLDAQIGIQENLIANQEGEIQKANEDIALKNNEIKGLEIGQKEVEEDIAQKEIEMEDIKAKKDIETISIKVNENEIDTLNKKIQYENQIITLLTKRTEEVNAQVKEVKENTDNILSERQKMLTSEPGAPTDALSVLLYSTTIQQNIAYFNTLKDELHDLRTEVEEHKGSIEDFQKEIKILEGEINTHEVNRDKTLQNEMKVVETEIEKLKLLKDKSIPKDIREKQIEIATLEIEKKVTLVAKINDAKKEIESLKIEQQMVYPLNIIQEPTSSIYPVKPKKKLNVLTALLASLAIGVSFVLLEHTYISVKEMKN